MNCRRALLAAAAAVAVAEAATVVTDGTEWANGEMRVDSLCGELAAAGAVAAAAAGVIASAASATANCCGGCCETVAADCSTSRFSKTI